MLQAKTFITDFTLKANIFKYYVIHCVNVLHNVRDKPENVIDFYDVVTQVPIYYK